LTTLHTFDNTDGAAPYGALVQDADGNFYGTTSGDSASGGKGTVYKITPDGTVTVLHSFTGPDGANPEAGLVLGDDGNLYGTTSQGGTTATPSGTIFKITPTGTLTTLHMFCSIISNGSCADGQVPTAALVQGSDGDFYGTAFTGGVGNAGTVFRVTATGDFTLLYSFGYGSPAGGPNAALVEGSDGNFYGDTGVGGVVGVGTVFKITPSGTLTVLHSFTGEADGSRPSAALLLASDGNFYGTTDGGGATGDGTVFKITPDGTLTTLHSFDSTMGADSYSALIEGGDGNFYGTASNGGEHGAGDIFRMTPSGTLTVLHSFDLIAGEGILPLGALLETQDGTFYGTTFGGGAGGIMPDTAYGTVYKLSNGSAALPPAPTALRAVADDGSVDLSWAAADGAASYNVYQGTSPGGEAAAPVETGISATHASIGGLTNGTTYYFTVAGVNSAGVGAQSNEVSATPLTAPGEVTGLIATPGDGSVSLSWNPVSGADDYTVAQGTSAGGEQSVATGVTGTSYTASGLSNGTTYYFTVVATNTAGSGPVSAEVSATPAAQAPPPPPNPGNGGGGGGGAFSPALLLFLILLFSTMRFRSREIRFLSSKRKG
ncbi:MAG: fibronectin type III domain-containing protein, partial [Gammaproteobacteria bacterium]|nr:fibronectin type III domain-containing protein [Gammaproteobacteria bacterium]